MPQVARPQKRLIRFTDEELALLRERARATSRPLARYVRETALGVVPQAPRDIVDAALLRQLGRVGNDLNQLAREARAVRALPAEARIEATLVALNTILDRL